ncbi:MAG: ABC transporter substrate-binding protein [Niveispirillum sp.]|uniref:ABC transporter substrate-binding protein n=1 Tax=Niveispirillum sp. TaxID=1917217 RepID=UPI004036FA3B
MNSLTRRLLLAAAGAGGLLALSGCGPSEQKSTGPGPGPVPRRGGRLRLGIVDGDRSGNLDAHKPVGLGSTIRGFALYSKLWEWSPSMTPDLALAEFAEVNDDATQWTIRLKPGLEFHNGKSITADDVIFSIRRLTDPQLASPYGSLVNQIDRDNLQRLDGLTVRVPVRAGQGFISLPDTWTNFGGIVPADYHPVTNPVGAGPYKLKNPGDYVPGQRALFTRFGNYFKDGKPYADELEIIEFKDQTSRIAALLAGQIDLANALLPEQVGLIRPGSGARVLVSQTNGWQSFDMNTSVAPFNDVRVRQAFRLLVDRQDLVERALLGQGRIANDLYSPHDPTFDSTIPQRTHDPAAARRLLDEAGYGTLKVELVASPAAASAALVLAEQAKKAGVEITVRKVDNPTFTGPQRLDWALSSGGAMGSGMLGLSWIPTGLHTDAPTSAGNKTHFRDPEFARLFTAALAQPDLEKRKSLVHAAQRIQHDSGGMIIWGFSNTLDGIADRVGGAEAENSHFPTWRFDKLWV